MNISQAVSRMESIVMNNSVEVYTLLLTSILRFNTLSTIVYLDPENGHDKCRLESLLSLAGKSIPLILWRSIDEIKLHSLVNSQFLMLVCLPGVYRLDLLNEIADSLRYVREAKVLIELMTEQDVSLVSQVLQFCLNNHMLNVAIISANFGRTHTMYIFDAYPHFMLKAEPFANDSNLFPDKTIDLRGFQIRTMPDLSEPNTIFYNDTKGNIRVLGYVWNMLEEYSRKHNAGLQLIDSIRENKILTHIQVLDMARDNIVDIAASVQPLTLRHLERHHQYAYPAQIASWCTMLPKEPYIEARESYTWMMPVATFCFVALIWVLHEVLHYQWHSHRRLIGIGWKAVAIMLTCNVQGRLIMLFVSPPTKLPLSSYDELSNSKLRIFGIRSEHNLYDFDMRTKYSQVFYLTDKMVELLTLRNNLNTTYAYTVTYTKWQLYSEQQSFSSRPLFYYSERFCFYQYVPFALVIPENSPHRATLQRFILQLDQSGLHMHWVKKSFYYMVQAGKLKIQELGKTHQYRSLVTQDLNTVLQGYVLGMLISLAFFVSELIIYRMSVCLFGEQFIAVT